MSGLRKQAAIAACTLYFICGQDALRAQTPAPARVGPDSIQIIGVTLVPVGGRGRIAVGVGNRTDELLWLRITVEAGQPVLCEGERLPLRGMKIEWFTCAVASIVAGRAYPVRVEVFRDEWDEESSGVQQVRPVFTIRDVQGIEPRLKP